MVRQFYICHFNITTDVNNSMSTEGDLFSGAEEMNAYQKSIELKKAIESDLFLAVRECHVPGSQLAGVNYFCTIKFQC